MLAIHVLHWNLNIQPLDMVITAREAFGSNIFREIIITTRWAIWLVKNGIIFDNGQVNLITGIKDSKLNFI
jgi:hypothetical protein